jgi:hypothetical protein
VAAPSGLRRQPIPADRSGVTTFPSTGRLLPAALARAAAILELPAPSWAVQAHEVPAGWERNAFDDTVDDDPFGWLGFELSDADDAPLVAWPRPERWPAARLRTGGRHRAAVPAGGAGRTRTARASSPA